MRLGPPYGTWHVLTEGSLDGPYSIDDLRTLVQNGILKHDDRLLPDGEEATIAASEVSGIFRPPMLPRRTSVPDVLTSQLKQTASVAITKLKSVAGIAPSISALSDLSAYQPSREAKELCRLVVVDSRPKLVEPDSTLRIIAEPREIVFLLCPLIGPESVAFRYPKDAVFLVRWEVRVAGLADQLFRMVHNEAAFGYHTGAIVSAIQGPAKRNCLVIGVEDATLPTNKLILVTAPSRLNRGCLDDAFDAIKGMTNLRELRLRQERQSSASSLNKAKAEKLREIRSERQRISGRMDELYEKLDSIRSARSKQDSTKKDNSQSFDVLASIERLARLLESGHLTAEEFEKKKTELLSRL